MPLRAFNEYLTIFGTVVAVSPDALSFSVKCRSADIFEAFCGPETYYEVIANLDGLGRDRVADPAGVRWEDGDVRFKLLKYMQVGRQVSVQGVYQQNGSGSRYEARAVRLMHSDPQRFVFEETHWWLVQTSQLADRILDHLFDAKRSYTIDDFSQFYRTQLNIVGMSVDENIQESAVLSRLIYDLSSAYLLTGAERYFLAAKAAVGYLREAFRSDSHDGEYCFWAYGRRRNREGERGETLIIPSMNADDQGSIPLYEQIYALAGLTQFYRITLDWEVLDDIRRTINSFQAFYHDPAEATSKGFAGTGGYYSHLDVVTMRPDSPTLGANCARKNWNSVGDHIPAYLINLILTLDPLPQAGPELAASLQALLERCWGILEETSTIIVEKFPDPQSDFVNERFHAADWSADHSFRWQQNRAVVGHNLKIAWNLTRCAFYFRTRAKQFQTAGKVAEATAYSQRADKCLGLARPLAKRMAAVGLDQVRGGIYDCVERQPSGGMLTQFAWAPTKDFWQQEQGILAYLILYGATPDDPEFLQLARESSAFWNTFFLDRERQGFFFRTTENGLPIVEGEYGRKGGHAIGYHAFELAYLAHLYTRAFVTGSPAAASESSSGLEGAFAGPTGGGDDGFCLYFKVNAGSGQASINVLPDFMPPGKLQIVRVRANGVDVTSAIRARKDNRLDAFQIPLDGLSANAGSGETELVVEFKGLVATA